jgi:hypothetical protein
VVLGNLLCSEQGQPLLRRIAAPPAPPAAPTMWAAVGEWWSGGGGADVEEQRQLSQQAADALRSALVTGLTVHNPTVVHVCVELTNNIAFTVRASCLPALRVLDAQAVAKAHGGLPRTCERPKSAS